MSAKASKILRMRVSRFAGVHVPNDAKSRSFLPSAFSLQEAAAVLGVSLNTLRRRIDAGQVKAERVDRPQGHVWRVYLDGAQHPSASAEQRADQQAGSTLHQNAASTLPQPAALVQAEAMAAYTRSVLEPLVTALERSEDRARELERENGRLTAELAAAQAAVDALRAAQAQQVGHPGGRGLRAAPSAPAPWWKRWLLAVYG
jgi:hypothetical protein